MRIILPTKVNAVFTLFGLLLFTSPASAQARFQAIAAEGDWDQATTWQLISGTDDDGVPDSDDLVTIFGDKTITINTLAAEAAGVQLNGQRGDDETVSKLLFKANAKLTIKGILSMPGSDQRLGAIDMSAGGWLALYGLSINGSSLLETSDSWKPGTGTLELVRPSNLPDGRGWNTYNNLVINVGTGTTALRQDVQVKGNLTIQSGTLDAGYPDFGYEIIISGNWSNEAGDNAFNPRTGIVQMKGTKARTLGGAAATTFYDLVLDNAGGTALTHDVTIQNSLNLVKGRLAIPASHTLNLHAPLLYGAPFGPAKHIVTQTSGNQKGVLRVAGLDKSALPDGAFTFPVGTGDSYLPAKVTVDEMLSAYEVSVFEGLTLDGQPGSAPEVNKENKVDAIWHINRMMGTQPITLTLNWNEGLEGAEFSALENNRILTSRNSGSLAWDEYLVGISDNMTNTSVRPHVTVFGAFRVSEPQSENVVLPVRFAEVKAVRQSNAVLVSFANLTEEDVVKYVIERSGDGNRFAPIGELAPKNNSNARADYSFLDKAPLSGNNFYRIQAVEGRGKTIYSPAVKITTAVTNAGLVISPNPVRGSQLNFVAAHLPAGSYQLRVYTISGEVVSFQSLKHMGGSLSQAVPLNSAKAGSYILELSGGVRWVQRFLVQ